jgi:diguanylate cyclase (GGDEF)-like protein
MLAESNRMGISSVQALLLQALYAKGGSARVWGGMGGAILLGLIGGVMLLVGQPSAYAILLVLPVLVVAWFSGQWPARGTALVAAVVYFVAEYVASASVAGSGIRAVMVVIVLAVLARALPSLRHASQVEREQALTDPLTNLGNRRFFRELAAVEVNRSRRYGRPVSLVCLDVDGFRALNDGLGHAEGDALLVLAASLFTSTLRTSDVVARIAGDEFAILLPETGLEGARVVLEKLRERLLEATTAADRPLTFSAAIVGFEDGPVSLEAMLRQADQGMIEAKRTGPGGTWNGAYEHPAISLV